MIWIIYVVSVVVGLQSPIFFLGTLKILPGFIVYVLGRETNFSGNKYMKVIRCINSYSILMCENGIFPARRMVRVESPLFGKHTQN